MSGRCAILLTVLVTLVAAQAITIADALLFRAEVAKAPFCGPVVWRQGPVDGGRP